MYTTSLHKSIYNIDKCIQNPGIFLGIFLGKFPLPYRECGEGAEESPEERCGEDSEETGIDQQHQTEHSTAQCHPRQQVAPSNEHRVTDT